MSRRNPPLLPLFLMVLNIYSTFGMVVIAMAGIERDIVNKAFAYKVIICSVIGLAVSFCMVLGYQPKE